MKRILAFLLAAMMMFCLVGCGEDANDATNDTTTTTENVTTTTVEGDATTTTDTDVVTTTTAAATTTATAKVTTTTTKATTTTTKATTTTTTTAVPTYSLRVLETDLFVEDGTLDPSLVVMNAIYRLDHKDYYTSRKDLEGEFYYEYFTFPEAVILQKIREKFVLSDADFEAVKRRGNYADMTYGIDGAEYKDGNFVLEVLHGGGYGGGGEIKRQVVGYTYANGVLKVCTEFLYDETYSGNFVSEYFYEVEYTYTGAADFKIKEKTITSQNKALIDSLRIRSIKKVTDTSPYTLKPVA